MDRRDFLKLGGVAAVKSVIAPTSAADATSAGWFNVRDYGAKGDGATDDTAAIRSAIEAARKAGGGVVWFPAGVYVTASLTLHGGLTFQGTGWQSILKLKASTNSHLIATPTTQTNYYGVVRDLCLDGNKGANATGNGIHLFAATYYRVEGVKVANFAGHGIELTGTSAYTTIAPWIVGCGIYQCNGNGIDVGGHTADCKIHEVDIGLCDKGVILPNSSFLSDVTIWQCNTGLYGYWAANAHLHMVRVERSRYHGFLFDGCRDLSIQQCRAYENNQSDGSYDGFAFRGTTDHPCVRINVSACVSGLTGSTYEKQRYGFSDGGSAYVDYILCQGCTALGNTAGGYSLAAGPHNVLGANM